MRDVMQDMATYSRSSSRLLESQETASAACPLTATRDGRENARKEGSPARSRPLADWGRHGSSPARLLARAMKTKRGGSYQDRGKCGTSPARARATQPQKRADVPRADAMSQAGGQVRRPPGKARTRTRKPEPRATSTPGGWKESAHANGGTIAYVAVRRPRVPSRVGSEEEDPRLRLGLGCGPGWWSTACWV